MAFNKIHFWQDRHIQGFIAGVIGWGVQLVFTFSMHALHVSKFRFLDFAAALGFAKKAQGIWEFFFAETIVLIMQGFLGAVFALLIKRISSVGLIFKGGLFGGFAWAMIFTIAILYKLKPVYPIDPMTAFIIFAGSVIWGAVMAWALLILNQKFEVKN